MAEGQSMFDKAKDLAENVKDKVGDMIDRDEDKPDDADDETGGGFGEKIDRAQEATRGAVDPMSSDEEPEPPEQPGSAPL